MGPYTVIELVGSASVKIRKLTGHKEVVVHLNDVKPYESKVRPQDIPSSDSDSSGEMASAESSSDSEESDGDEESEGKRTRRGREVRIPARYR